MSLVGSGVQVVDEAGYLLEVCHALGTRGACMRCAWRRAAAADGNCNAWRQRSRTAWYTTIAVIKRWVGTWTWLTRLPVLMRWA
jgi:hypothetical protein